ncbi:MAG: ParB/RepB/Spo0J family partition protein [Chloroflexi bacterium]|nr:ParB/RepB/Spo0J family partition protein [Chloroflexota bacterium]MBV9595690.1 ParB/RepB/Spo0J family partition protein [Chloroflexota bacterium]
MTRGVSTRKAQETARARPARVHIEGAAQRATLTQIPIGRIDVPGNPTRRQLGDIAALAESMQDYGLQQPVSVRVVGDRYALTSGMRRLAAAKMLRWTTITGFVRSVTADEAYLLDLIENLQREDLSPAEEADAFGELIRTRGWTVQQVADSVKRSVAYVSKRVRVFDDPLLREAIVDRGLPVSTAEELLAAPADQRRILIERALAERWDQVRARAEVRPVETEPELGTRQSESAHAAAGQTTHVSPVRPRGLTHAIRQFHRLVLDLHTEDLTQADRAALRSLFRDLLLLAREPTTPRERVFPELPNIRSRHGRPARR